MASGADNLGREHGRFLLDLNGRVICIRAFGQWNEQTAVHFVRDFKVLAATLVGAGWAVMTDLREWELGVPEMEPHMNALDLWCVASGQTHEVAILPASPVVRWQLEQMFADTQSELERTYEGDVRPACEWLAEQGFEMATARCRAFFGEQPVA